MISKLHYISQGKTPEEHLYNIERMCAADADWVQLRLKDCCPETVLETAISAKEICDAVGAKLVINDHVMIAKDVAAYGLHLGSEDCCPVKARTLVGDKMIIGGTANTLDDCMRLVQKGVNYIGLGPYRFTKTKKNLSPVLELQGYHQILTAIQELKINIPIIAIGGLQIKDIPLLLDTGIHGVAVSGLLTSNKNPDKLIDQMNLEFEKLIYEN